MEISPENQKKNYLCMCVFVVKNKYGYIINKYFPTNKYYSQFYCTDELHTESALCWSMFLGHLLTVEIERQSFQ
jgi:hypothetical protein